MKRSFFDIAHKAGRLAVLGILVTAIGLSVAAAQTGATTPSITRAVYKRDKAALIIVGSGFDENAVVRLNGTEVSGERKFNARKGKLRITIPPADMQLKPQGQNQIEVFVGGVSSGEFDF